MTDSPENAPLPCDRQRCVRQHCIQAWPAQNAPIEAIRNTSSAASSTTVFWTDTRSRLLARSFVVLVLKFIWQRASIPKATTLPCCNPRANLRHSWLITPTKAHYH